MKAHTSVVVILPETSACSEIFKLTLWNMFILQRNIPVFQAFVDLFKKAVSVLITGWTWIFLVNGLRYLGQFSENFTLKKLCYMRQNDIFRFAHVIFIFMLVMWKRSMFLLKTIIVQINEIIFAKAYPGFGKNKTYCCCGTFPFSISYTIFNFSSWRSTAVIRNGNWMLFVKHFLNHDLEKNTSFFQITMTK